MNLITRFLSTIGPLRPGHALAICLLFASMVLLGGCAVVEKSGDWVGRQASSGWTKVVQALRPAPKDETLFAGLGSDDSALNAHLLEARLSEVWNAEPVKYATSLTVDNGVRVYRPGQGYRVIHTPAATPAALPSTPDTLSQPDVEDELGDSFAYVRLDGGSDMADWQACEVATGGAFIVTHAGTTIADDFDRCLRAKGYMTETEARQRLRMKELAGGLRR